MKIEEIEKLNSMRTQGDWKYQKSSYGKHYEVECVDDDGEATWLYTIFTGAEEYGERVMSRNGNMQLAAQAPKMADMLIKLKNFKTDNQFAEKCVIDAKLLPDWHRKHTFISKVAQAAINVLLKEIESDD